MNLPIAVCENDESIILTSPYCPDFPPKARALGGDWLNPFWVFPLQEKSRVLELCQKIYGECGEPVERGSFVFTVNTEWRGGAIGDGVPLAVHSRA